MQPYPAYHTGLLCAASALTVGLNSKSSVEMMRAAAERAALCQAVEPAETRAAQGHGGLLRCCKGSRMLIQLQGVLTQQEPGQSILLAGQAASLETPREGHRPGEHSR